MPAKAIESFVEENPGRTATQIAEALYGVEGYHQRVSSTLRLLSDLGRIERRGSGGRAIRSATFWRKTGQPRPQTRPPI
jgi:hypothetical protein